jgi:hypothetical protein
MNEHRKAVVLFAVALAFAIVIASVTTLERVTTHKVSSNDTPPGTTGSRSRTNRLIAHRANQYRKVGRCAA